MVAPGDSNEARGLEERMYVPWKNGDDLRIVMVSRQNHLARSCVSEVITAL